MRYVVLDTETTGSSVNSGNRIVEIAGLEMLDRRLTQRRFQCYLNPERDSEPGALAVHGLTTGFLRNKPSFTSIADEFLAFVTGATLIIHNAPFDIAFLDYELKLARKDYRRMNDYCQILDTLPLARARHPGQRSSLDALCKMYGIDNSMRAQHSGLLDAELLARVYLAMTGGQSSLFSDDQCMGTHTTSHAQQASMLRQLCVVLATASECETHEQYLSNLFKRSGKCMWPRLDVEEYS